MPTSEWNAATSCGISVMAILRAVTQPMPPPIAMAPRISGSDATSCVTKVVTTAISMPAMPKRLPRCDVAGDDSPRNAKMKNTPEIKYASITHAGGAVCSNLTLLFLIHSEHACSHSKAAENIYTRKRNCNQAKPFSSRRSTCCSGN